MGAAHISISNTFFNPLKWVEREPFGFRLYIPPPSLIFLLSTHQPNNRFTHSSNHQSKTSTMKSSAIVLTVSLALAASAFAAPKAEVAKGGAVVDDTCFHGSHCSINWSGNCEDYCQTYGGFSHMTGSGCGWFSKKCCCNH
jgi:hypothetical protein